MQFIVNSTFIINTINTDISIVANLKLATIQDVLEETSYETGIETVKEIAIKKLSSTVKIDNLKIPVSNQRFLSSTDKKLLNLAYKNRRSSLLVTDDKVLRSIAKENKIRCYTTPQFIAYLIKKNIITKDSGIAFMTKLQEIYIRPKDIDKVITRINRWR